ncbi:peptidoglycan-binding protein [Methylobacterium sp. Leaf123]|uniref:trypsin-like peptidase domain-containing protein n=1 Tax=Methylobacterium sp. Leaf123 TaxID=1736264 RepID=UPI0006F5707F|nr:trypsin-like peptidase domain-containing protein [Methylobacterium sp. Leaf123]KQQ11877.1 peptidoglycan-binding protein [Methylobacterium sp. Leaf123]
MKAFRTGLPALLAAGLATGALAQGPLPPAAPARPKPPAAPQPAPDPAFEAARTAFEALPEAERRGLQDSLVWTGDYNGVTTGAFGKRSFDGIQTYQTRTSGAPTGLLTPPERAALKREAEEARRAARFRVQPDPASGVVVGVPEALLPRKSAIPGGTRWQSADGRVTLDTKSFPQRETSLDALFERAIAAMPGRKVTYKLKKPDFIVITAETAGGRSYIRYAEGPQGIRGFTLGYDRALADMVDRLVIAVANNFSPFPEDAPASTAPTAATAPAPRAPAAGLAAAPAAMPLPAAQAEARPAATGLLLGGGRVLTAASALESCAAPRIGGAAARIERRDAAGSLALLSAEGLAGGAPPQLRAEPVSEGEALLVLGAQAKGRPSVAPASAASEGVYAPLQPGAGGAPVLDRSGRVVGLVARFPTAPRLIAGVMPPTRYAVVPGKAVAAFLSESGLPAGVGKDASTDAGKGAATTLGGAAAPVLGAVVAITCAR